MTVKMNGCVESCWVMYTPDDACIESFNTYWSAIGVYFMENYFKAQLEAIVVEEFVVKL